MSFEEIALVACCQWAVICLGSVRGQSEDRPCPAAPSKPFVLIVPVIVVGCGYFVYNAAGAVSVGSNRCLVPTSKTGPREDPERPAYATGLNTANEQVANLDRGPASPGMGLLAMCMELLCSRNAHRH
jgi:hypothetical protein